MNNMIRTDNTCTSGMWVKREIMCENLKLKEEIRKLNKIMVDKEAFIKNNELKIENLIVSNQNHRENLKNVEDLEKVALFFFLKGKFKVYLCGKGLENKGKDIIRNFLIEKEAIERRERKKKFFNQCLKLGKEIIYKR